MKKVPSGLARRGERVCARRARARERTRGARQPGRRCRADLGRSGPRPARSRRQTATECTPSPVPRAPRAGARAEPSQTVAGADPAAQRLTGRFSSISSKNRGRASPSPTPGSPSSPCSLLPAPLRPDPSDASAGRGGDAEGQIEQGEHAVQHPPMAWRPPVNTVATLSPWRRDASQDGPQRLGESSDSPRPMSASTGPCDRRGPASRCHQNPMSTSGGSAAASQRP